MDKSQAKIPNSSTFSALMKSINRDNNQQIIQQIMKIIRCCGPNFILNTLCEHSKNTAASIRAELC